ncbi:MAG: ParB/RepB/Spo0J family partition protein [Mesorhizobium sp.]
MIRVGSPENHGLSLDAIQIDGGTQSRDTLNDQVVNEYAEAIKAGATFPPIVVFYDGKKHWLADGFHRFHAYQKAGKTKVAADVRQGTRRDAILFSVGANETHGLRRTRDDKRRAVLTLLNDAEWSTKPETWIAETCRVSRTLVRAMLAEQPHLVQKQDRSTVREVTRGGTTYAMQTAGIGAKPVSKENLATEASTPQPILSKASSAETVDLGTTPSRNIVAQIMALWAEANEVERDEIRSFINSPSADSANMEPHDVDRSAERASSAVEVGAPVSPEGAQEFPLQTSPETGSAGDPSPTSGQMDLVEAGTGQNCAVLPQEPCTAEITPSAVAPAEPEASPSPPPASGNPFTDPQTPVVATADQAHQASQLPAQNDDVPHVVGQGGHEPVNHYGHAEQEDASATQARNEPGSVSGATVTNPKPFCLKLKDGHCKIAFETAALCAQCNAAKARAA